MRWLSSLAILMMLSLWCTPQAFAVHDSRLSPLADTSLHAVLPVLHDGLNADSEDSTDQPGGYIVSTPVAPPARYSAVVKQYHADARPSHFLSNLKPRAPPFPALI
ncbi:hypothetical protein MN202_04200 [Rheinheimera muenzenbergensis]|uniref:Uncharacterized protein n=1 Tax=Rheinheimera muenzenbergensis TaxID=1193628 RepID=A0ABU8C3D1_9GAMM